MTAEGPSLMFSQNNNQRSEGRKRACYIFGSLYKSEGKFPEAPTRHPLMWCWAEFYHLPTSRPVIGKEMALPCWNLTNQESASGTGEGPGFS